MPNGFLHDSEGDKSSKRLVGVVLLGVALIMASTLFIFALKKQVGDPSTCLSVLQYLFIAGTSLLGIGVAEGFTFRSKDKEGDKQ
jgi:hypothetical protein